MLGRRKLKRAVEPLCAALSDKELDVVSYALMGLQRQADPRAVKPILALVKRIDKRSGKKRNIHALAVDALRACGGG